MKKEEEAKAVKTAEQIAEENERLIVRFTNIDHEAFTHSFRGISTTIDAGKSVTRRFTEGDHLATHLARKILSRKRKAEMTKAQHQAGKHLYNEQEVQILKDRILTKLGSETPKPLTPKEIRDRDIERIEKEFPTEKPKGEVTKADVIKELKELGAEVDINKSKEELLKQRIELEAKSR